MSIKYDPVTLHLHKQKYLAWNCGMVRIGKFRTHTISKPLS